MKPVPNAIESYMEGLPLDTPSKILIAALIEFGKAPVKSVGTRDIAKRAGVNIAAISYYFDGKDELYALLVDQIIEYFNKTSAEFRQRLDALVAAPDKQAAKQLLRDYIRWRVMSPENREDMRNDVVKSVISIVSREEFNNTPLFKKIHDEVVKWSDAVFSESFKIIFGNSIDDESARILALSVSGMLVKFTVVPESVKYSMQWRKIGVEENEKICQTLMFVLERLLKDA